MVSDPPFLAKNRSYQRFTPPKTVKWRFYSNLTPLYMAVFGHIKLVSAVFQVLYGRKRPYRGEKMTWKPKKMAKTHIICPFSAISNFQPLL